MTVRHRPRVLIGAIGAVSLLGACGTADPASSPSTSAELEGLRPAVVVTAVGSMAGAGAGADVRIGAESAAPTDISMMPAFVGFTFEAGDDLPSLPPNATGYQYPLGAEADEATVAALAEALGIATPPERIDDVTTGLQWRAGPEDGTAPSLGVNRDPQLSWYYSGAWGGQANAAGCYDVVSAESTGMVPVEASLPTTIAVGGDAVVSDDGGIVDGEAGGGGTAPCTAPEPPAGVPTAAQAEADAIGLLAVIGEDPAAYELETYADEWSASVIAWPSLDDVRSAVSWSFGFGGDSVLQWASGALADPVPAGPYPLVDLDTALARLIEQNAPSSLARDGALVDAVDAAPASGSGVGSAESTARPAGEAAATGDTVTATIVPEPEPEPAPPEPTVLGADPPVTIAPPAPGIDPGLPAEPQLATLVDVRADFWWTWDDDGSVWLLPAYTFTDTEGRQHTVPAVTDEFLVVLDTPTDGPLLVEPTTTVPAPTAPIGPPATAGAPVPPSEPIDPPSVDTAQIVGLTVDEATDVLTGLGLTLRVVREDGVDLLTTLDFSTERVNVAVEAGTVVAVVSMG